MRQWTPQRRHTFRLTRARIPARDRMINESLAKSTLSRFHSPAKALCSPAASGLAFLAAAEKKALTSSPYNPSPLAGGPGGRSPGDVRAHHGAAGAATSCGANGAKTPPSGTLSGTSSRGEGRRPSDTAVSVASSAEEEMFEEEELEEDVCCALFYRDCVCGAGFAPAMPTLRVIR